MTDKVFVYGTLKKGQSNHGLLNGSVMLDRGTTAAPYIMRSAGGYPVCFGDGTPHPEATLVSGEIYEVSDEVLSRLDQLEGHPDMFCRELVRVDGEQDDWCVWMYLGNPEYWNEIRDRLQPVVGGVWSRGS